MISFTLDEAAVAQLRQAQGLAEIRDGSGTVIGFFAPVSLERAPLYAEAAARIDPTAIQRQKQTPQKTHTTEEVLAHLDSLEKP
jgi:hypothetical protein